MGEALFRHRMRERPALAHVGVSSAGTIAHEGQHPPAEAVGLMRELFSIDISPHQARLFGRHMQADLILTVDRWTTDQASVVGASGPVQMLGDFVGTGEEVEDPYGGPVDGYQRSIGQLDRLVDAAIDRLETDLGTRGASR